MNDDTYVSGIPGLVNPQTIERMNRLSVTHWKGPMEEFLSITYDMVLRVLLEQLDMVFLQYQQTALYGKLRAIVLSFMDCIRQQHFQRRGPHAYIQGLGHRGRRLPAGPARSRLPPAERRPYNR